MRQNQRTADSILRVTVYSISPQTPQFDCHLYTQMHHIVNWHHFTVSLYIYICQVALDIPFHVIDTKIVDVGFVSQNYRYSGSKGFQVDFNISNIPCI